MQRIAFRLFFVSLGMLLPWCGTSAQAQVQVAEGSKNIIVPTIASGAVKEPMLQIGVTNPTGSPAAQITQVRVTAGSNGTGHDVNDLTSGSVQLYLDADNNGKVSGAGDTLLGSGVYGADNGSVTFSGLTQALAINSKVNLLVVYTLGPGAVAGESFRARIAANADIAVRNASTLAAMTVSGAPVEGYLRTVGRGTLTITRIAQTPDGAIAIPNLRFLPLINLDLLANDVEDVTITQFNFDDIGTADVVNGIHPLTVKLYTGTAKPTASSIPAAAGDFTVDNGTASLTLFIPLVIPRGTSQRLWLTIDVKDADSTAIGSKFQVSFPATSPLVGEGNFSHLAPTLIGAGIHGPEWEFNYNPITYTKPNDLGAVLVGKAAIGAPILGFVATNDVVAKSEKVTFTRFIFHGGGTINEKTDVAQVQLWKDGSPYGRHDASDVLLATSTYDVDNGEVILDFTATPQVVLPAGKAYFLLTYDMAGTASDGQTIKASLLNRNDVQALGEISLVNSALIPVPFESAIKTVNQPRAEVTLETAELRVPTVVAPEATDFPLVGLRVKNGNDEDMRFSGLRLNLTGPLDERRFFRRFRLFFDSAGDGKIDIADTEIPCRQVLSANGGDARIEIVANDGSEYAIARGQQRNFTLYADIATTVSGTGGETFNIVAPDDDAVVAFGVASGTQFQYTTPVPPFTLGRTIRNPVVTLFQYPTPAVFLGCINGSYGLVGSRFQIPSGEDLLIRKVRFTMGGTLDDSKYVVGAMVWHDLNKDFLVSTTEAGKPFGIQWADHPVSTDNGTGVIDFSAQPAKLDRFDEAELSVAIDFQCLDRATAVSLQGRTANSTQAGTLVIEGVGARSGRTIEVTNAAGDDTGRTIQFDHGSVSVTTGTLPRWVGPPACKNMEIFSLRFNTNVLEPVTVESLRIRMLGTLDESKYIKPRGVKIWMDDNRNGKVDSTDYLYAQLDPPASDNGDLLFLPPHYVVGDNVYSYTVGSSRPYDTFLFTVDLMTTAPEGKTVQMQLQNQTDLTLSGALSLVPFVNGREVTWPTAPPLTGHPILIQRGAMDLRLNTSFANDADNKPQVTMAPAAQGYEVARFDFKATEAEDVRLTRLTVHSTGTAHEVNDIKPGGIKLLMNGTLLTTGTFTADNGVVVFDNFRTTVTGINTTAKQLSIQLDGSGAALKNSRMQWTIAASDLQAVGLSSELPITRMTPADPLLPVEIRFGPGRLTVRASGGDGYLLPIPGASPAQIQPLSFSASRTEGIALSELQVRAAGTANELTAIQSGALQFNGHSGSVVTPVASAGFSANNGLANLRSLNVQINADGSTGATYSLDVAVAPGQAISSTTLQMNFDTTATVAATGKLSNWPAEVVFEDLTSGENRLNAPDITGSRMTLSTGLITLRKGTATLADAPVRGAETKLTMMHLRLEALKGLEGVTITGLRLLGAGTVNEALAIKQLYLYQDVDADGRATAADVLLAQTTCGTDNGVIAFTGLNITLPEAASTNWIVVADLMPENFYPQTLTLTLPALDIVQGSGQLTEQPLSVTIGSPEPDPVIYNYVFVPKNATHDWVCYD